MLELIKKTRTYRRFAEHRLISDETLLELVNLARLGGSARNCQPWQYMIINNTELCKDVFPYLAWAGYLSDWKGPLSGEQPSSYILCLLNRSWLKGSDKEAHFDLGIASQNLLLGAMKKGIAGCRIGAYSPEINTLFEIPDNLELALVIALGFPAETVVIEETPNDNDIRYWRDSGDIHHVPKRSLTDIVVNLKQR
ncbi:MAG: nitroreductase family protein [Desulfobacterales bacterium]|nr:nitroreductase family protein [Desulfobacterales bacterium]